MENCILQRGKKLWEDLSQDNFHYAILLQGMPVFKNICDKLALHLRQGSKDKHILQEQQGCFLRDVLQNIGSTLSCIIYFLLFAPLTFYLI